MKRYPKCDCGQVSKFHFINDHDHVFGQYELVNGRERLYENVGVNDDGDDYYFDQKLIDICAHLDTKCQTYITVTFLYKSSFSEEATPPKNSTFYLETIEKVT